MVTITENDEGLDRRVLIAMGIKETIQNEINELLQTKENKHSKPKMG